MQLGIRSIFLGLFRNEWTHTQQNYLTLNNYPANHQQANQALITISYTLLQHVHSLWEIRNQDLHGPNKFAKSPNTMATTNSQRTLLVAQVKELYEEAQHLLAVDKTLFNKPVKERIRDSNTTLKQWIHFVKPLIRAGKKAAKAQAKNSHKPINTYYEQPSSPPTTTNDTHT